MFNKERKKLFLILLILVLLISTVGCKLEWKQVETNNNTDIVEDYWYTKETGALGSDQHLSPNLIEFP